MSKLTDLELRSIYSKAFSDKSAEGIVTAGVAALRAIEAAATDPLLQRIAELESLLTEKHNARVMWQSKAAERERQLEEARKDAERYRWLRDVASGDVWGRIGNVYAPDETDEAIDAAMQKGQS